MSKEFSVKDIPPIIAVACVIFPALSGYNTFNLGYTGWLIAAALTSGFAMYCYDSYRPVISVMCGIIMGITAAYATQWYFSGRSAYLKIEVAIPLILGMIPGGFIYIVGKKLSPKPPILQTNSDPSYEDNSPKRREQIICNYVEAYNSFDIPGMLRDLSPDIHFEDRTKGELNVRLNGLEEFRERTEETLTTFKERKQTILAFRHNADQTEIDFFFLGVLAVDVPIGPRDAKDFNYKGRSVFTFSGDKIVKMEDV